MGSVVDLYAQEFGEAISSATNLVLTRPLDEFHIALIQQTFDKYHNLHFWCGYSILDQFPPLLKRNVMSSRGNKRLGAVLFCREPDQTHFVFRDLQQNFRLINTSGHTVLMEEDLEVLLDRFHNTLQH
ncbi:hypothetical protein A9Q83_03730 [Alphaproteobacteria bacterium 46_93_T64]|nr:hypothetical protein A9Q83_03730 [Alphaproteobacteria bacterium 46_93_T64]